MSEKGVWVTADLSFCCFWLFTVQGVLILLCSIWVGAFNDFLLFLRSIFLCLCLPCLLFACRSFSSLMLLDFSTLILIRSGSIFIWICSNVKLSVLSAGPHHTWYSWPKWAESLKTHIRNVLQSHGGNILLLCSVPLVRLALASATSSRAQTGAHEQSSSY